MTLFQVAVFGFVGIACFAFLCMALSPYFLEMVRKMEEEEDDDSSTCAMGRNWKIKL